MSASGVSTGSVSLGCGLLSVFLLLFCISCFTRSVILFRNSFFVSSVISDCVPFLPILFLVVLLVVLSLVLSGLGFLLAVSLAVLLFVLLG